IGQQPVTGIGLKRLAAILHTNQEALRHRATELDVSLVIGDESDGAIGVDRIAILLLHCMSPLLAQSRHELVLCTCLLLTQKDTCRVRPSLGAEAKASRQLVDGLMHGAAVPDDIVVSAYELLERRIDVVKINVGSEAIYAGVNAGG